MDKARQKELKLAYKLAFPPMGIYAIRNLASGRLLMDRSLNLMGALNRHRMELRQGVHRHAALMADWRLHGEAQFSFEVIEQLKERPEPDFDYITELADLLARWRSKLPSGTSGSYL